MNYNDHYAAVAQGFMSKVYSWMAAGLCVTAGMAYYLSPAVNPQLFMKMSQYLMIFAIVQFVLGLYMSMSLRSLSYSTAAVLFTIYSGLMGIVLSPIAYMYTGESIFQVFLIAAGMFAVMAVYGSVTKTDLSSMGNILMMGLFGLIIANLINMFWQNAQFDLITSCVGVGIFTLMTAFDVQMLQNFSQQAATASQEDMDKIALFGAFSLYLNLINLMIYLLRLFGKKRD